MGGHAQGHSLSLSFAVVFFALAFRHFGEGHRLLRSIAPGDEAPRTDAPHMACIGTGTRVPRRTRCGARRRLPLPPAVRLRGTASRVLARPRQTGQLAARRYLPVAEVRHELVATFECP